MREQACYRSDCMIFGWKITNKIKMYKMIQDTGLDVFGFQGANGLASVFIGLGSETAAQNAKSGSGLQFLRIKNQ